MIVVSRTHARMQFTERGKKLIARYEALLSVECEMNCSP